MCFSLKILALRSAEIDAPANARLEKEGITSQMWKMQDRK